MRHLVTSTAIIATVFLTGSCGDKKNGGGGSNPNTICTPNATSECDAVPPAQVNNQTFVAGLGTATCSADGTAWDTSACTLVSPGTKTELQYCDPNGADCISGLKCFPLLVDADSNGNATLGECLQACSASTDCNNSEVCDLVYLAGDYGCSQPNGVRDQSCGYGFACESNLACVLTYSFTEECKELCPAADIGTPSSCTNGETCLQTDTLLPQLDPTSSLIVQCKTDGDCDTADEFHCVSTDATNSACIRVPAACGKQMPTITDVSDASLGALTGSQSCDLYLTSQFCAPSLSNANATVTPSCTTLGYFDQQDGGLPCTKDSDCNFNGGFACTPFDSGSFCVTPGGFCLAYCETLAGDSTGLNCGDGFVCAVPPAGNTVNKYVGGSSGIILQVNGSAGVSCTADTDCDQGNGFACSDAFSDGKFCARQRKLCQAAP